ncbi:hypothetical protein [Polymorphobacter megasporae]|uniref:hypothetical protein n=1 Tax=Glacieibacterium megasporae TaxID=2835787 RepID=UPI001C1E7D4B|nr:hypothetical protein [Polymorphobacter megasporae]UAJ12764.1 hypothetical protein KTC28_19655 [Polymorphobacter megasporae]
MLMRLTILGLAGMAAIAPALADSGGLRLAAAGDRSRPSPAAAACPFLVDSPTTIAAKSDSPAEAIQVIGEMADKGEPFQVSDALPAGPHPPWSRFVSAQGQGCDLTIDYEHGGIGHFRAKKRLHFDGLNWTLVNR